MIVYRVEDARSINKREEETSKIRAKVPSSFPATSANFQIRLNENFVEIEPRFLLNVFGSFFSKPIDFLCNEPCSPRIIPSLESGEAFVNRRDLA